MKKANDSILSKQPPPSQRSHLRLVRPDSPAETQTQERPKRKVGLVAYLESLAVAIEQEVKVMEKL